MKSILISIKPKYVTQILNGEKTIEIRKTTPKCDLPIDVYIYCTKGKEKWWRHDNLQTFGKLSKNVEKQFCAYGKTARELDDKLLDFLYENGIREGISRGVNGTLLNGRVVAKFTLNKVEMVFNNRPYLIGGGGKKPYVERPECKTPSMEMETILEKSCLSEDELFGYLGIFGGYAWHISNLVIFDEPKELIEFKKNNSTGNCWKCKLFGSGCSTCQLTKAPQSWCCVEQDQYV